MNKLPLHINKMKKALICYFLLFICSSKIVAHSVQIAYCISCNGDLRIFVEHWHGTQNPNSTTMAIQLNVNGNSTTQTNPPVAGLLQVPFGQLPGCTTPITSVAGCQGQMNTYNDWVYYDFFGLPAGVPLAFTIISGNNSFTSDGCGMFPLTVNFTVPPTTTNGQPVQICQGQNIPAIGVPVNVNWTNSNPAIGLPASGTGPIPATPAVGVGTSVVTYTNACGVNNTTISVVPALSASFNNNGNGSTGVCLGNAINFTNTSPVSTTYTWNFGNGSTSNAQNPSYVYPATGTYTVSLTVGDGPSCPGTSTQVVVVNAFPTITAVSSGNVCQNTPLTLSASGGSTYVWVGQNGFSSNSAINNIASAQPYLNGTFTVTGTSSVGCSSTATLSQVIYTIPIVNAQGSKACISELLYLNSNGASSYAWQGPLGFTSSQQNPSFASTSFGASGVYTVTGTSSQGCVSTATTLCQIYPNPTISYSGITSVCKGTQFSFNASGAVNYKWLGTFGIAQQGPSFSISSASPSLQLTYTVVGTDANGCSGTAIVYPQVLPLPTAKVIPDLSASCPPLCTKFTLTDKPSNLTNTSWSFSNGSSINDSLTVSQCFNTPGIHRVNINLTDDKGCKGTTTQTVEVYPNPIADFTFDPTDPHENNNVVSFYDASTNAPVTNWHWDFASNGIDTSNKNTDTHTFPYIGNYFVKLYVKSNNGCKDSIVKKITVSEDMTLYIPNAFTPNGDGLNDTFNVYGVGIKKYNLEIFDRWGNLIYNGKDISTGWDGKHKKGGDVCEIGVYQYKLQISTTKDGKIKTYTGHVTLMK